MSTETETPAPRKPSTVQAQVVRKLLQERIKQFRIRAPMTIRDPELDEANPRRMVMTDDPTVTNMIEVDVFAQSREEAWALLNTARDRSASLKDALARGATITEIKLPVA